MRSSNNPRNSFSSSHSDNFDLDDLIEDLQSLNSPSLSNASQKSIKQNSSFYNNNSNTGTGSVNRTEADSYKRPIGIAGGAKDSSPQQESSSSGGNFIPHPPLSKGKSPVSSNPKNKFAVLPENSSRGVSPVFGLNDQNSNNNANSKSFQPSSSSPDYGNNSTSTFPSSYKMSASNRALPELERPAPSLVNPINLNTVYSQSQPSSSRPNSFDRNSTSNVFNTNNSNTLRQSQEDRALNSIFEELKLNDNEPVPNTNPSGKYVNNGTTSRIASTDSWDEDSVDSGNNNYSNSNNSSFRIPKVKGTMGSSNNNLNSFMNSSNANINSGSNTSNSGGSGHHHHHHHHHHSSKPNSGNILPPTPISSSKTRCSRVLLGGTHIPRGLKNSAFSKIACDSLLCSQCNFKVLFFYDHIWDPSIDYMFFRNNMPNVDKLSTKLVYNDGSTAYCCQCQWHSEKDEKQLTIGNLNEPKWICAGHNI